MNKRRIAGIIIFLVLILIVVGIKFFGNKDGLFDNKTEVVYVATGGGKEDFLKDEEILEILRK